MSEINEDHPIWQAIDTGGGQTCNVPGVLRALTAAGYVIVPREPSKPMILAANANQASMSQAWNAMIDAALKEEPKPERTVTW